MSPDTPEAPRPESTRGSPGDRPPEPPPERVRSTPGQPVDTGGPVPVRDLMKKPADHEPPPEAEADPRWDGAEREFLRDEVEWIARSAGAGAYGTGRLGAARLIAVHFFRATEPDTPVREALLPAGAFPLLGPRDLAELFDRATPIPSER